MPVSIGAILIGENQPNRLGQARAVPFLPSDNGGLALWLRAPTTSYITGTTQAVDIDTLSSWLDSVGSKSFAQGTAANRPRYCVLETVPTIRFDGANRTQCLTYTNKVFGNNTDFTVSIAFRRSALGFTGVAGGTLYSECNSADTSDIFAITYLLSSRSIRVILRDSADLIINLDATTVVDDNKIHVVTVTLKTGVATCWIDGVQQFSTNYATTVTGWATATFNRTTLGARTTTTVTNWMMTDIYEVVGYTPSLDAATVARHNSYLYNKYVTAVPTSEICANSIGSALYSQAIYKLSLNKTFMGHYNSNSSPQITVIDHGVTPATKITYSVDDNIGPDRHDSCAVAFAKSGKIMAFYDNHNNNVLYFNLSTAVGDASAWGTKADIGPGTYHTYLHAVQTTEGAASWRVYVYYRDQSTGSWNFRYSDNDGTTWAAAQVLWQPVGVADRQIYGRARMCADGNIHFFLGNDDVDGAAGGTDLYHFMYKPSDGKYYKSNGTTEITSLPFDATDATKCYDSSDHGNRNPSFVGDIMTSGSTIYIAIGTTDGAGGIRLCRLVYTGSWAVDEILTPTASLDCSFKPADPNTIYYQDKLAGNTQLYKIVYAAAAWGAATPLGSGDHFTTIVQGPFRVVDAELGGPVDVGYQHGHYADQSTPYGELFCYPAP